MLHELELDNDFEGFFKLRRAESSFTFWKKRLYAALLLYWPSKIDNRQRDWVAVAFITGDLFKYTNKSIVKIIKQIKKLKVKTSKHFF